MEKDVWLGVWEFGRVWMRRECGWAKVKLEVSCASGSVRNIPSGRGRVANDIYQHINVSIFFLSAATRVKSYSSHQTLSTYFKYKPSGRSKYTHPFKILTQFKSMRTGQWVQNSRG